MPYGYLFYIILRTFIKICYRYLCRSGRYIWRLHCEIMNDNGSTRRDDRYQRIDQCLERRSEDGECTRCGKYFVRLSAHHIRCRQKKLK